MRKDRPWHFEECPACRGQGRVDCQNRYCTEIGLRPADGTSWMSKHRHTCLECAGFGQVRVWDD